jgi:hypothetical protein
MSGQSGTTQICHCLSVLILFTFNEIILNGGRNNETRFSPLKKWQINYNKEKFDRWNPTIMHAVGLLGDMSNQSFRAVSKDTPLAMFWHL